MTSDLILLLDGFLGGGSADVAVVDFGGKPTNNRILPPYDMGLRKFAACSIPSKKLN